MRATRVRRLVSAAGLPLACVLGMAALASAPGVGCAQAGHESESPGDDGSAPSSSGGGGGGSDGGSEASAQPSVNAAGLSVFSDTCTQGQISVGSSPLRRISRVEYDNMVRDLLGDNTAPADGFDPESPMSLGVNFDTNTYESVAGTRVPQEYQQTAETLGQNAVASANALSTVFNLNGVNAPCNTQNDACAQAFIASFANRAFRGQLDMGSGDTEAADLFAVYSATRAAQFDFATGIQAVITTVLESPRFLFVLEFGSGTPTGNVVALSGYEIAARLSLALWRSVPDTALMQAATMGALSTSDQVQAQASRMLADPKAASALADFTTQWMQIQTISGKDQQFNSTWGSDPNIVPELKAETIANFSQAVLGNSSLTQLLTSSSSYINAALAKFYGGNAGLTLGTGPAVQTDQGAFYQTNLGANRAGILTNAGVLAAQSHSTLPSSVLRGKLVREQVLCDVIGNPPPFVPAPATGVDAGSTTRSVLEAHYEQACAINCHRYMDPIGLGFGSFDATGAYQATDANGFTGNFPPIDATGQILTCAAEPCYGPPVSTTSGTFNGAVDLANQLAASKQVAECFALQQFRYTLGRVETPADACSAQQIYSAFTSKALNLQQAIVAIAGSDAFRYRRVETAGSACQ
jgi:Protein of unknown function (DUF1592)/Protein of unknown function (DUF1588)/Protein of unknown function (DUF1585)/Protein of unknown function (DUF1595)/Protein of unknown function (DUF1587)